MSSQEFRPTRVPPRPQFRRVAVQRVERLTPNAVRVTLGGEEFNDFAESGPASHVRLFFPPPGKNEVILPRWGANGPELPPGVERPVSRAYTPRRWDAEQKLLEIDFYLHGSGPASTWAAAVRPGDRVVVAGPRGLYRPHPATEWLLLAADESALPAVATILESLPPGFPVRAFLEVEDAAEEQALDTLAAAQVQWLHRAPGQFPGRALESALRAVDLPGGGNLSGERVEIWVGCEAGVMRDIRRHLLHERGFNPGQLHTYGYWRQGESNHPDHDTGDDVA